MKTSGIKGFANEFKEFAVKGNVMDMAVGVIIGGAFGKIVTSLVNDVLMPVIGYFTGGVNFSENSWVIQKAVVDAAGEIVTPEITVAWGAFVQAIIDFIIVAFCIFLMVKFIMNLKREKVEEPAPEAPAEPTEEVKLLTQIRDLLDKNK